MSKLTFTDRGWAHYLYWQEHDLRRARKLNQLIEATRRTPFSGIGKPEPLVGELSGYWSRRIDDEHRLVYRFRNDTLEIVQCRFHYRKK